MCVHTDSQTRLEPMNEINDLAFNPSIKQRIEQPKVYVLMGGI